MSDSNNPQGPNAGQPAAPAIRKVPGSRGTNVVTNAPPVTPTSKAILLGQRGEPGPLEWLVDRLIPAGYITSCFGDGGVGKSFLALYLALCVILGRPFFGRTVRQGAVLWYDAEELGREEVERRAFQVARGLGLEKPPHGLYYYTSAKALTSEVVGREVRAAVGAHGIGLVILDSLSAGANGVDLNSQVEAVALFRLINAWKTTVLALDHVSKKVATGEAGQASAFGSRFKHNLSRSTIALSPLKGGLSLRHEKSNFGPKQEQIAYAMVVEDAGVPGRGAVRFSEASHLSSEPVAAQPVAAEATWRALQELYQRTGEPVDVAEIARHRGVKPKTVQNNLTALKEQGRVEITSPGLYVPVRGDDGEERQPPVPGVPLSRNGGIDESEPSRSGAREAA